MNTDVYKEVVAIRVALERIAAILENLVNQQKVK